MGDFSEASGERMDLTSNLTLIILSHQAGPDVAEKMLNQNGHFYVCGSARQVPEDIYTAMKEAPWGVKVV